MARYVHMALLCMVLLGGSLACAPKMVGPTSPSGYVFSVIVFPSSINRAASSFGQSHERVAEITVQVQDAQGNPVDGVPVEFTVGPSWAQDAIVQPDRVSTQAGQARARFQAQLFGNVRVMVRVEDTVQPAKIFVRPRGGRAGGS